MVKMAKEVLFKDGQYKIVKKFEFPIGYNEILNSLCWRFEGDLYNNDKRYKLYQYLLSIKKSELENIIVNVMLQQGYDNIGYWADELSDKKQNEIEDFMDKLIKKHYPKMFNPE